MNYALALTIVTLFGFVIWNTVPSIRSKIKGWSTVLEASLITSFSYLGILVDATREAKELGVLPEQIDAIYPIIFFAWVVAKRAQTDTIMGDAGK